LPCPRLRPELDGSADVYAQVVAVKVPRVRIAWVMVAIAIVAINIAAIKAVLDHSNPFKEVLLMGTVPMANALVVGLMIGYWSRRSRRFLLGFEAFGVTALSPFAGICLFPEMINLHYRLLIKPYGRSLTMISITVVVIGLTQLAFALVGGFLSHKFGISERIERTRC
jgi:hypothetical protein